MMQFSTKMILVLVLFSVSLVGCGKTTALIQIGGDVRAERTTASYMSEGRRWGKMLLDDNVRPGTALNEALINTLIGQNIDYFNVHEELKEAFKRGFRMGYEERVADLVLGPHITEAAGRIGNRTGKHFVEVVESFETGWGNTLNDAVRVFIVLVAEGSQADRKFFINQFDSMYADKYDNTQKQKKEGKFVTLLSEGGTKLYLNIKTTSAFLDIPSPQSLKGEIYRQAFRAMGDEWGKRLSTNLIRRPDLVDLLRRTKVALKEEGNFKENLGIIYSNFFESYGADADEVFASLLKEAGYNEAEQLSQLVKKY